MENTKKTAVGEQQEQQCSPLTNFRDARCFSVCRLLRSRLIRQPTLGISIFFLAFRAYFNGHLTSFFFVSSSSSNIHSLNWSHRSSCAIVSMWFWWRCRNKLNTNAQSRDQRQQPATSFQDRVEQKILTFCVLFDSTHLIYSVWSLCSCVCKFGLLIVICFMHESIILTSSSSCFYLPFY